MDNMDCMDANCVMGSCVIAASCNELIMADPNLPDGVYVLDHDGMGSDDAYMNYCDMTTDGGGWTLVLKAEGGSSTFEYSSGEWTSQQPFGTDQHDLTRTEAKLPSWTWVDFTQVMVGMEAPIGQGPLQLQTVILDVGQTLSLYNLISPDNFVPTSIGRNAWLGLVNGSNMQANCNREGFNVLGDQPQAWHRVRIGIIANELDDCGSPDSRLGIGGAGTECGTDNDPTGNFAGCIPNQPVVNIPGWGVIFVR